MRSKAKVQKLLTPQERMEICKSKFFEFERELERQECVHVTIPPPNVLRRLFLRLGGHPNFGTQELIVPREQLNKNSK